MLDGTKQFAPAGTKCILTPEGIYKVANGAERYKMSSSSFVQNYSLLYSSSAPIYNNRVGFYDVSLGYNWTGLNTTFDSSEYSKPYSYDETRGHLLYNGEITLDPREVPLKLHIYSRDMKQNTLVVSEGDGLNSFDTIFSDRNLATNINDGTHIESGATLIAGVKNGMTNGYNEILRHFPMILIDYKNTVNKDLSADNRIDDRLSRLAFVSLNKKDNWFHYRHTLYEDKINSTNNYEENELQLGTVDQYMARRWIDFSNWIKISTDIQFSKRQSNYQQNPIEDINLNLFLKGERKKWSARVFTSFDRLKDDNNTISYKASLPVYASGFLDQNTSWDLRTAFRNDHDIYEGGTTAKFTDSLFGYRVETFKQKLFTLSQSLDVEASQTKINDYLTIKGSLETKSTSRFSRDLSLGASYNVRNSATSSDSLQTTNFFEQSLALRGSYALNNKLRFQLSQTSTLTNGNFTSFSGSTRNAETLLGSYYNPRAQLTTDIGNETYHSLTSFSVSYTPKPRFNVSLTLNEDIFKSKELGLVPITDVITVVSYTNEKWRVSDSLKYTRGSLDTLDDKAYSLSHSASIMYTHNRNINGALTSLYETSRGDGGARSYYSVVDQRFNYNYFSKAGVSRKIFEINESLLYSEGNEIYANTARSYTKSLTLNAKYYPIKRITLAAGVGYSFEHLNKMGSYRIVYNASAAANFRMLQVSLDYLHGNRVYDKAVEDRFTGNIKKTF
ncbi:MAG: hypothetical protein PHN84_01900 [Desulfuromonadaceae bacterium]|nr:hypothetical protein [Desulfuromonadaceae bacterium]MDD2856220.1 hypothetical protein [Desulfuromonadaceae bacterium]